MENEILTKELMDVLMNFKKNEIRKSICIEEFNHSQMMALLIIHDLQEDGKVSLMDVRKKIKLAPSTVTPIISSLEEDGLIERNIDETDRRNIYLKLSQKGEEYTKKVHVGMTIILKEYISFMGKKDILELIRLLSKTTDYFKERNEINEKNI